MPELCVELITSENESRLGQKSKTKQNKQTNKNTYSCVTCWKI